MNSTIRQNHVQGGVAQVLNLLYRRFAIGGAGAESGALRAFGADGGCKPAIQQVANLRYERGTHAFTLIELLVVISIIGVLAGLTVGLTGLATRKSKESRIRAEMTKIINGIENYKATLGFYPPDNPGYPSTNQLFYELCGTTYQNNQFYVVGRQEAFLPGTINGLFHSQGFANAQRNQKDLKFTEEFKASQFKRVMGSAPMPPVLFDVLAVPVPGPTNRRTYDAGGPVTWMITYNNTTVNPWLYVSSSPTNNPDRYDLWCEVAIGGKVLRFSNWEKDPVALTQ